MELTGRFECIGDDGQRYTVTEYTHFIERRLLGGRTVRLQGMREYFVDGGGHANFIDENTFEVVQTGVRLTRL